MRNPRPHATLAFREFLRSVVRRLARAPTNWFLSVFWAIGFVGLASLTRFLLGYIEPGVAPYALYFPAVLLASLLGGWRGGGIASLLSVAAAMALFVPRAAVGFSTLDILNVALVFVSLASVVAAAAFARTLLMRLEATNERLADQHLHYDTLFQTMSEGFALCEAIWSPEGELIDYTIVEMNPALQRMLGADERAVGMRLSDGDGVSKPWLDLCGRVLRSGEHQAFEFHNPATDLWHEIHVSRVTDTRLAQFFFDITERKRAAERQAELFDELNHRTKNNLAMVSSLLQMQARNADETVRQALLKAVARVQSIAQVHSALYRGSRQDDVEVSAYLMDLGAELARTLVDHERISLKIDVDPGIASIDTAIPLAMIVNELVTNAAKYAYPSPQRGRISVTLKRRSSAWVLKVADKGQGLPTTEEAPPGGLGMRLVSSLIAQIHGDMLVHTEAGATFEIRLPLETIGPVKA